MKIKIGDQWHDSDLEPMCIQLNETEKDHIANMGAQKFYASFPDDCTLSPQEKLDWIREGITT